MRTSQWIILGGGQIEPEYWTEDCRHVRRDVFIEVFIQFLSQVCARVCVTLNKSLLQMLLKSKGLERVIYKVSLNVC